MFPESECGICYRTYNIGRRCPRQLSCKHTFCESCLVTLGRSADSHEPRIVCPLCRHSTKMLEAKIKDNLPVDEDVFERLVTAGSLEECEDEDEDAEDPDQDVPCPARVPCSAREDVSPPPRTRKGQLVKCLKKAWKKVIGDGHISEYFTPITCYICLFNVF